MAVIFCMDTDLDSDHVEKKITFVVFKWNFQFCITSNVNILVSLLQCPLGTLLRLIAVIPHVTILDLHQPFIAMSSMNHITCVQSFHVHQSVCNGHHFINHMVITLSLWKLKWITLSMYDIMRVGKATCSTSVLFGYGNCLCGMHFDQYISEVSIFSISKLFMQYV